MKLVLGRYDYAAYGAFIAYACSSLVVPLVLVDMGRSLDFPLDAGGMSDGGFLEVGRSVAMVITLILCGSLGARFGKRYTMGTAMLFMSAGLLCCSMAPSFKWLTPSLFIAGLGEGICEGMATPFVHDLHKDNQAGYVSIAHSFWSVGIVVCVLLSGLLLAMQVSWRGIIATTGVFAASTSLMFFWKERKGHEYIEKRTQSSNGDIVRQTWNIVKSPRFWVYCVAMFIGAGAEFCLTFWIASFLRLNFNASAWFGGLGTVCLAFGMFLGRSSYGKFIPDRKHPHLLITAALSGIPVTLLIMAISKYGTCSQTLTIALLFFLLFLSGFSIAPYWPILQVYGAHQLKHLDSTMLFIWFSTIGIPGCATFTWLMGFVGDKYGLDVSFFIIPANMALYAIIVFLEAFIFPRKK